MAATGEWELVVKSSSKKGKNTSIVNGKLTKDEEREFLQKAPKATFVGAIETTTTPSPSTPVGKENRKPKTPKVVNVEPKKKEKKNNSGSQQPRTIDEAMGRLSVGEMQSLLDVVMSRFLDTPLIWLKDLASYLNVRLNPVRQPDPIFKGQDPTYPASRLATKVKMLLLSTLDRCNDSVLASFHKHCVTSMVQEQIKGLSVSGYKLFIQILAIHRPQVGVVHLQSYIELFQSIDHQTPTCLSLLWAVGQSGLNNFGIGLKVWMEVMVPLIGLKNYSAYAVEYGSNVFSGGGGGGTEDYGDVLGVREFFYILDLTWVSSGSLTKPIQRELFALYPKVKTTAFTSSPENVLRNFFPSFLCRLNADTPDALKTELRTCLVQCLMQDVQCASVWSQLYHKHIPQSAILLTHLASRVDMVNQSQKTKKTDIQNTLKGFAEANKQMAHKVNKIAGLAEATEATNRLLSHLKKVKTSKKSTGSRFWSILMTILITGVLWDIKSAGSFYDSKVGLALERAGLVPYVEAVGRTIRLASIQAYRWCLYNIPFYYNKGCDLAEPYLVIVWARLEGVATYVWAGGVSAVHYIPVMRDRVEESIPGLSDSVSHYGNIAWNGTVHAATVIQDMSMPYLMQVHEMLSTKVFVGALAPEKLREYTVRSFEYISQLLLSLHSALLDEGAPHTEEIPVKTSL